MGSRAVAVLMWIAAIACSSPQGAADVVSDEGQEHSGEPTASDAPLLDASVRLARRDAAARQPVDAGATVLISTSTFACGAHDECVVHQAGCCETCADRRFEAIDLEELERREGLCAVKTVRCKPCAHPGGDEWLVAECREQRCVLVEQAGKPPPDAAPPPPDATPPLATCDQIPSKNAKSDERARSRDYKGSTFDEVVAAKGWPTCRKGDAYKWSDSSGDCYWQTDVTIWFRRGKAIAQVAETWVTGAHCEY